jgi:hypothetical protein
MKVYVQRLDKLAEMDCQHYAGSFCSCVFRETRKKPAESSLLFSLFFPHYDHHPDDEAPHVKKAKHPGTNRMIATTAAAVTVRVLAWWCITVVLLATAVIGLVAAVTTVSFFFFACRSVRRKCGHDCSRSLPSFYPCLSLTTTRDYCSGQRPSPPSLLLLRPAMVRDRHYYHHLQLQLLL